MNTPDADAPGSHDAPLWPDQPPPADGARPRRWPGGLAAWLAGAALVVAVIALVTVLVRDGGSAPEPRPGATAPAGPQPTAGASQPAAVPASPVPPAEGSVNCPTPTVSVSDADGLKEALAGAQPGATIALADGVYEGKFVATTPGTSDRPVHLCGGPGAVLDGGGVNGGYVLHLNGANFWRVVGFTVRNGQKGVMADRVSGAVIQGLVVEQIGDEGIHLRNFSSDNVVQNNTVRNTGNRRDTFGEGIYVGTAESNWKSITGGQPDTSDRNIIRNNTISETTSESIDIKEGTTGGQVVGNRFDGARFSGNHADSWVDVKGNNWTIEGNTGRNSKQDGFQTHEVVDGWGTGNVFTGNIAEVNGPGFGFNFTPVRNNRATCDNKVTGAAKGFSNVPCG